MINCHAATSCSLQARCCAVAPVQPLRRHSLNASRLATARVCAAPDGVTPEQQRAMEEAMADPNVRAKVEAMEEAMENPEMQQQMAQMQAVMSNPQYLQRMAEMREDPELKPIFDEIRAGGVAAMMKYMSDPEFLAKIGEKMGDIDLPPGAGGMAPAPAAPAPVVNNILDAAKYGDIEAVEDYMAIGKGDLRDDNDRTALHYAVAYDQGAAAKALIDQGADVNAVDSAGNTSLHFAAGYGRREALVALLQQGADKGLKNGDGLTPADIVKSEPRNPLNQDAEIMGML